MALRLDKVDLKIIESLKRDARRPVTQIAKEVGVSRPTVINRLNRLITENLIHINVGLNIRKLGFHAACVALEVKGVDLRRKVEEDLFNCPRVLSVLRLTEKANLMILFFGETHGTLISTIESLRDFSGADIVYVHYSEPPLFTEAVRLNVFPEKSDIAPCGRKCSDCFHYQNDQCIGCPAVIEYKGPL